LSSFSFSSALGSPGGGRNEGISVGGGEGDGDLRNLEEGFCGVVGSFGVMSSFCFEVVGTLELEFELDMEESESDSDSDDSWTGFVIFGMVLMIFGGDSSSEEDESELGEELEDETARLLRFRVRFLGAGFVDLAGGIEELELSLNPNPISGSRNKFSIEITN
jgi:hypothetical protein